MLDVEIPDSEEIRFKKHLKEIDTNIELLKAAMLGYHTAIFNMVWAFPEFSAKKIIEDGFGQKAGIIFKLSSDVQGVLAGADPTYQPLIPTAPVTFNEDGSATVTEAT
jgi:hypothetical protein